MAPTIRDIKVICTAPEGINLVVVKVETSEPGLYGLGCATFAYRHLTVQHLIETYLRPLLIGKDVRNISDLWQLMHQNAYWRCGPIVNNAISGVDMALWDIKGKMANMPVYDLFGGKMRAGVPVYRHVDGANVDEICENIEKYRSIGVKHIRCQCGGYGGGGFGPAPEWAAKGAEPGVYLDSKKYMRDTLKLFDGIRAKDGVALKFVFQTSINAPRQKCQQVIKQACQKAGIALELKSITASVFFSSDVANPDTYTKFYADMQMYTTTMPQADPERFMNQYVSWEISSKANNWQGRNIVRFRSDEYDTIFHQAQGELDPVKRAALFIRMNDLVVSSNHIIPLVRRPTVSASLNSLRPVLSAWDSTMWLLRDWWRQT